MILIDLFESRMSDLDMQYQDYKDMSSGGFYSRYKMTKDQWAGKHWSLIKGGQTIHEGAMKDLHTELSDKYQELAPKIEKYKDSYLAGQLYDALEAIAIEHGAELELKRMMTGARNRAHMDYDTNPGGFQNWFWYLPFADDEQDVSEAANVNPQFINAQVTKILATEARRVTNAPVVQLLAPIMKEYGLTLQQIDAMVPGGLKKAAAEYGIMMKEGVAEESQLQEKQDACYHKVKSRYKVWPSAYASGALVQCRKKGAANWGNKSKE